MTANVTICMPVYKSESRVAAAIESVLAQTYREFVLHVSVDPSDDRSAEVCRSYAHDPRVTVFENPERLGWAGNTNACLDRIETPYFAFCFHDDALEPNFLERLVPVLEASPNAVAAFGALQRWGTKEERIQPKSITGSKALRAQACLNGAFPAYGLKNLLRSEPVFDGLRLPEIGEDGFVADLPFALGYSLAGDFLAVDELVYRKLHATDTVMASWSRYDIEQLTHNQNLLRLVLLRMIGASDLGVEDRQQLVHTILRPRGAAIQSSPDDLMHLADDLDAVLPTLLIAELLGPGEDTRDALAESNGLRSAQARNRATLAANFKRLGQTEMARQYAEQAVRLDDTLSTAHRLLASLFLAKATQAEKGKNAQLALFHAERATELEHEHPKGWLLLARAKAQLEDWPAVASCATMSLTLGLQNRGRAERLQDLAARRLASKRWRRAKTTLLRFGYSR